VLSDRFRYYHPMTTTNIITERASALLAEKTGIYAIMMHVARCENDPVRAVAMHQERYMPVAALYIQATPEITAAMAEEMPS